MPLCSGPFIGHNDRGDPSLLSLTGWGSVGVEAKLWLADRGLQRTGWGWLNFNQLSSYTLSTTFNHHSLLWETLMFRQIEIHDPPPTGTPSRPLMAPRPPASIWITAAERQTFGHSVGRK